MNKEITIRIKFSPQLARAALLLSLLCWAPGQLESESVLLSVTYPSPTGVYGRIITTGSAGPTLLATQSNFVGIGSFTQANPPPAKLTIRQENNGPLDGIVLEETTTLSRMGIRNAGNRLLFSGNGGNIAGIYSNGGVSVGTNFAANVQPPNDGLLVQGAVGVGADPGNAAPAGTLVVSGSIGDSANPGCQWIAYLEGATTECPNSGTVVNWSHSGAGNQLVDCPGGACAFGLPRSGSMLCCRLKSP